MVRTHGGHRYRPRVRFSTPEREDAGTSKAVDAHSLDLPAETQPALAPAAIPEEPQASEPPSRRYQTRVGPRAPSPMPQRRRRRALPSKRARTSGRGSLRDLDPSRHLLLLMRVHRLCYHRPRGSGAPCSSVI